MIFGIAVFPMPWSRQGNTQEFFDKFKAGLRTHKSGEQNINLILRRGKAPEILISGENTNTEDFWYSLYVRYPELP